MKRNLEEHVPRALHAEELARDEDEVLLRLKRTRFSTDDPGQRRREVNVRRRLFLNRLHDAAFAARDDVVELVIDLTHFGVETALFRRQKMVSA